MSRPWWWWFSTLRAGEAHNNAILHYIAIEVRKKRAKNYSHGYVLYAHCNAIFFCIFGVFSSHSSLFVFPLKKYLFFIFQTQPRWHSFIRKSERRNGAINKSWRNQNPLLFHVGRKFPFESTDELGRVFGVWLARCRLSAACSHFPIYLSLGIHSVSSCSATSLESG